MPRLLLLALLLAACAPRPQADPLLVAYDLANELAAALSDQTEHHEAALVADLDLRFAHCRRTYEGEDPRPCFRVQAGLAKVAAAPEQDILSRLARYHREALAKLKEAKACRQAAQPCEGPAREAADALLIRIKAELADLPLPREPVPPLPASPQAGAL
jgi:hypothetical protein